MDRAIANESPERRTSVRPGEPWVWLAWATAFFGFAVCAALFVSHHRAKTQDPWQSPQLTSLKEKLVASPKDESLKEQIRTLDLQLRARYFRQLSLKRSGAWLLLGAGGLFLLAGSQVARSRKALPMPQPRPNVSDEQIELARRSRWSVATVGAVLAAGFFSLALSGRSSRPRDAAGLEKLFAPNQPGGDAPDFASLEELQRNWPCFRGFEGAGISTATNVPLAWDVSTGQGIRWKSPIAAAGFNSPIVWGNRLFVSGADETSRVVLCYGTEKGELLWQRPVEKVPGSSTQAPEVPEQTGYAASTMATDGRRVYAIFATGDLAAWTLDGRPVWTKNLGVLKNPHGHASSLATWEDRVIVQLDQGEAEQNRSRLYAFDGRTGRVLWERTRSVPASWSTPIVIQAAGKRQIITLGVPWVIAYAAADGAELWRVEGLNNEVTPSPVFANGLVLAVSPNEKLIAIRPEGQGEVTKTHIAWEAEDNIPDITSPVSDGELVFTLSTPGMLTCYDLKDGKKLWEEDLGAEFDASPSLAARRLYLVSNKGSVRVAEAGRAFKELARNEMGEAIFASPAFVGGKIFMRGTKHLFCIGEEEKLAQAE
jgi:outer membrane protein assembly factor BamB